MRQQGSAQLTLLHLFVLFGLGSCLFLRKGRRRKIQDLTGCNVHRFYTPLALSSQWAEVPKHLLKGKGMLQAMQLKPFQMIEEEFCVVGQLFWNGWNILHYKCTFRYRQTTEFFFFGQVTRQTIQPHICLDVFNSRMADLKTDIY